MKQHSLPQKRSKIADDQRKYATKQDPAREAELNEWQMIERFINKRSRKHKRLPL